MRSILLNITEGLAFLTLPATCGLALVAPEFVRLILGPEWSAAIVPLQLLSIYASYRSLVTVLPQVLTVKGDTKWTMWLGFDATLLGLLIGRFGRRDRGGVDHRLPSPPLPPDGGDSTRCAARWRWPPRYCGAAPSCR
jgi:hypothetical protein